MKKLVIVSGLIIAVVTITYLLLPYEDEMSYRESDMVRYHLYTPASIKQAPRLSQDYIFSHFAANGQPESNGVCFSGVSDAAALKQYLVSRDFIFTRKVATGELWTSDRNPNVYFTITRNISPAGKVCLYESTR